MSAAMVVLPRVWALANPLHVVDRKGPIRLIPVGAPDQETATDDVEVPKQMAFYRKYTEGMLRRYVRLSMEAGRAPSLLGREMFRGRVTNYEVHSFEDVVIFVHDVGRCLAMMDSGQQYLVRRIALQEYTLLETATMTGLILKTVARRYTRAIDRLTELFLERDLLEPQIACQEAESDNFL
ncbi:hypothetical protein [Granulicella sibirica]|uniref:Uncharacterized protein n=1 Tax=Granulicella sibirica TaxID=2479048 RepID=A0A4Q0T732_9BACT|nr:hypothetical protein [Granulicella sibirica]RXH58490.1 hypothetical protein GRAN_1800 [Granulicella sibirica]